mgnify:CR=1 FL=1
MRNNKKTLVYIIIIVTVAISLSIILAFFNNRDTGPGKYDDLAQCITKNGVKFFGAFWCPHCAEQKKLFGNSTKLLPYVECSTPNAVNQTQECMDAKIESYPTWQFADGSRTSKVLKPEELATLSQCTASLPITNTKEASSTSTQANSK